MAIKIFIDQGHNPGGINSGAEGNGLVEQTVTYAVGIYLRNLLASDPRFEARVSRETFETILGFNNTSSLMARVDAANTWGADYFISIHCNANTNPAINGTEVYIYSSASPAAPLAQSVLDSIVETVGTKDNGVRENRTLYVLRKTTMPAILVELAYLSNLNDAQKLLNNQYEFAYGIYLGILDFFGYQPL